MYFWRAVDDEGEVLQLLMQRRRDTGAARKSLERLLRRQPIEPETITTERLSPDSAALPELDLADLHRPGRLRRNHRAENAQLPIRQRERRMQGFKSQPSAQRVLPTHAAVYDTFAIRRHLIGRPDLRRFRAEAHAVWAKATA